MSARTDRKEASAYNDSSSTPGTALPATLLALIALAALASAGFLLTFVELRTSENYVGAVRAFYVADAGLNEMLASRPADTAAVGTSTYAVGGGTATVVSQRLLRLDRNRDLRLVTSGGVHGPGREGAARRTVAELVVTSRPFRPLAALVSASPIAVTAPARVSGFDVATAGCGAPAPSSVAGLAIAPNAFLGAASALAGTPALWEIPNLAGALAAGGLDWASFSRPSFLEPEEQVTALWPDSVPSNGYGVAVYASRNAAAIDRSVRGRGVLVVAGDLTVSGELVWEGLVLVGGAVRVTGRIDVRGGLLAGLDALMGASVNTSDLSGNVRITYDSCAIAGATARLLRGPGTVPGSWFERF